MKLIQCTDCLVIRMDDGANACRCGDGGGRPVIFDPGVAARGRDGLPRRDALSDLVLSHLDQNVRMAAAALEDRLLERVGSLEQDRNDWERRAKDALRVGQDALAEKDRAIAALEQHVSDLEKSLEDARKERAEWERKAKAYGAELDAYIKAGCEAAEVLAGTSGMLGEGLVAGARRVVSERDAALADNAALLRVVRLNAGGGLNGTCLECGMGNGNHFPECVTGDSASRPHPGAALLEEHATKMSAAERRAATLRDTVSGLERDNNRLKDELIEAKASASTHWRRFHAADEELRGVRAQAQVDAKFLHEALGWVGEWPSSLPAPSRAVVALLERMKRLEGALDQIARENVDNPYKHAREVLKETIPGITYAPIVLTTPTYAARITGISEPTCMDGSCAKCRSGEPCH